MDYSPVWLRGPVFPIVEDSLSGYIKPFRGGNVLINARVPSVIEIERSKPAVT